MFPLYKVNLKTLTFWDKLNILLWKNFKILSYKNYAVFIFVALPVFTGLVLCILRHIYPLVDVPVRFHKPIKASYSLIYTK